MGASPLQQTNAAKPMLAKINFPREALVISGIYQTSFNAGIKLVVLLGLMWVVYRAAMPLLIERMSA